MTGAMQQGTLRLSQLIDHAAREHGMREIVSQWSNGVETRGTWKTVRRDGLRMVQALARLGIGPGERVATLAMNHYGHLVAWYGAVGAGAVLHTLNPRLFDDQLEYIVNHAQPRVLIYDAAFAPVVERLRAHWPSVSQYLCFDYSESDPGFFDWLAREDGDARWAAGPEDAPAMLCYTSGTTGHPKGVLFTHRSILLHTWATIGPQCIDLDARAVAMPVVPMFHANNWGLPWGAAAVGAGLVYCAVNDPARLLDLIAREGVNYVAGVPTVWLSLTQQADAMGVPLPASISHALTGGSAIPRAMVERLMRAGIRICHCWGMTETSPIATTTMESADWHKLSFDEQVTLKTRQGKPLFGMEIRIVALDDPARQLPRDGRSAGALQVRGPWVVQRYFRAEADAVDADGWFDTGDVAVIHPDGTLQLTDRTKDVIKSGGEWISSVELENAAIAHPAVAEAAAIGIAHPKWDERPLLVVVTKPDASVSAEELQGFLAERMAKWWVPDAVEFVSELPHTGSGKISKKDLRQSFADWRWP